MRVPVVRQRVSSCWMNLCEGEIGKFLAHISSGMSRFQVVNKYGVVLDNSIPRVTGGREPPHCY